MNPEDKFLELNLSQANITKGKIQLTNLFIFCWAEMILKLNIQNWYVLEGVNDEELSLIKDYYINPVEMREIDMDFIH